MMMNLRWKNKLFSNTTNIYSNDQAVGKLVYKTFSSTTHCELFNKKYKFITKGFFKQHTEIYDESGENLIAEILYGKWSSKATIVTEDRKMNFEYDGIWNSNRSISDSEGLDIKYSGSTSKGEISSNTDSALPILSGLFISNYYFEIAVAVFLTVIVVLLTAINK